MVATQLTLYNGALLRCEERGLASLTEAREPRYLLDSVWNGSTSAIDYCLEMGQWNFAIRSVQADYSPSVEPAFGYTRAFNKPTDWLRTAAVASDQYFTAPLEAMFDEGGYWYADLDTIFVRFVSNDINYGNNMGLWPPAFTMTVEAYLASRVVGRIAKAEDIKDRVMKEWSVLVKDARGKNAMDTGRQTFPRGTWSRSRIGQGFGDRGNSGSLLG
jgi:hypothetical protein